jgi:hypothetical protein
MVGKKAGTNDPLVERVREESVELVARNWNDEAMVRSYEIEVNTI